ncbi:hypothetical protein [Micromonospora sp. DH14]|uniref:hypothetical protein n=1 Tax=Micromonospora sp. DH14 TaxID=3040120 RepID=UPI0024416C6F|nr:hypothetical protein [Micromonospora sp. DH14]MDG9676846.1 hypothetical protein [Micromonospora sp. DH14]
MPEQNLDDGLRSLAEEGARRGRLADAAVVRQRGDAYRRRRHVASAAVGVAVVGLLGVGVAVGRPAAGPPPPAASPTTAGPSASAPTAPTTPPSTPSTSAAPPSSPTGTIDPVLSGQREITIVRVQATEGGIALDGQLTEVDDDSGRQLFVPTPLGGDAYLIKAYGRADNHPANDEPACWQATNLGNARSLTVEGAVCDANNPAQRFTITASGTNAYAISNRSAYLQHSKTNGLILEEVADGPVPSTFRLVDNGPARRPAGG